MKANACIKKAEKEKPKAPLVSGTGKERLEHEIEEARAAIKKIEATMKKASIDKPVEYRCSRCRWSVGGTGCDSRDCNPHKYLEKLLDLLKKGAWDWDKYQKEKQAVLIDISKEEGGGYEFPV